MHDICRYQSMAAGINETLSWPVIAVYRYEATDTTNTDSMVWRLVRIDLAMYWAIHSLMMSPEGISRVVDAKTLSDSWQTVLSPDTIAIWILMSPPMPTFSCLNVPDASYDRDFVERSSLISGVRASVLLDTEHANATDLELKVRIAPVLFNIGSHYTARVVSPFLCAPLSPPLPFPPVPFSPLPSPPSAQSPHPPVVCSPPDSCSSTTICFPDRLLSCHCVRGFGGT